MAPRVRRKGKPSDASPIALTSVARDPGFALHYGDGAGAGEDSEPAPTYSAV